MLLCFLFSGWWDIPFNCVGFSFFLSIMGWGLVWVRMKLFQWFCFLGKSQWNFLMLTPQNLFASMSVFIIISLIIFFFGLIYRFYWIYLSDFKVNVDHEIKKKNYIETFSKDFIVKSMTLSVQSKLAWYLHTTFTHFNTLK